MCKSRAISCCKATESTDLFTYQYECTVGIQDLQRFASLHDVLTFMLQRSSETCALRNATDAHR